MVAKKQCRDREGPSRTSARRRLPLITIALMGAAIAVTLLLLFTDIDEPYIGDSYARWGAVLILVPPLLLIGGTIAAAVNTSAGEGARVGWGVASAAGAFFFVPGIWILVVWISGP